VALILLDCGIALDEFMLVDKGVVLHIGGYRCRRVGKVS